MYKNFFKTRPMLVIFLLTPLFYFGWFFYANSAVEDDKSFLRPDLVVDTVTFHADSAMPIIRIKNEGPVVARGGQVNSAGQRATVIFRWITSNGSVIPPNEGGAYAFPVPDAIGAGSTYLYSWHTAPGNRIAPANAARWSVQIDNVNQISESN